MKKICICTTISLTLKSFVVPTAEYLHKKCGYDVTLICNTDEDFARSLPDYIHFIPVHMARGIDLSAMQSIQQFIKIFKEQNFDMVQYSTPNAACYASIAAKIAKVPIRLYCQWGIRYVGMSGISRKIFKAIEKMVCRNSTDIRVVSPLNKEFAVSEGLYKAEKAGVVGHGGTIGVDTTIYDIEKKPRWKQEIRSKYGIADNEFVFGFSGRISADKGCQELFASFRELERSGFKGKLFLVGPIDDDCGIDSELINWAKTCENVVFTGMVDGSEMCKYYSAMDVLVHPTYREGFGMVIQEAGALAVPVITTKIPGASEVMEDGVSCLLVEPKSVPELKNAMRLLLSDQNRSAEIGRAAYKRTKQYYDRPIMLENQLTDYRTILGENMNHSPRILVFTVAAWNSKVGSNTWATLLDRYPSENIANICIREEKPDSNVCSRYFVVSENRVLKSILNRKIQTGYEEQISNEDIHSDDLIAHNNRYNEMKKNRRYSMLLARELVWKMGKWKTKELDAFLDAFQPDIILHSMEGYIHLNRIITYAIKRTGAKAVGYIWDDNFTYLQSDNLGYKVYRFFQRRSLRKLAKHTNGFFSITDMTKREADAFFGIESVILTKPLSSIPQIGEYNITYPIRMLYTGKLTIGRDRTIEVLNRALKEINRDRVKIVVDIYTSTVLLEEVEERITDGNFCVIHPPIPQAEALQKQKEADVLLFVEDIDGKDARIARLSFSTKITDYLSSGKCIFAIGNRDTAPMNYFMENDAAVTAYDYNTILSALQKMVDNPAVVSEYAQKAMECGIKNHDSENIHRTFDNMIKKVMEVEDEDTLDC